jgi:hypothetical protein
MIALSLQTTILSIVILACPLDTAACVKAQPASAQSQGGKEKASNMSRREKLHVQEAADGFIARFRETLDFGVLFDEAFVADSIQRLRKAGFFKSMNISPELIEHLDDPALERAYKAFMNFYYLKSAYDLSARPIKGNEQEGDPPPPPEVTATVKESKYLSVLLAGGSNDVPYARTRGELDEFIADLDKVAAFYKRHLPRDFFRSPIYKENLKVINGQEPVPRIKDGYESFGVKKGTKVYQLEKDIFNFFFIEENGGIKVLTLGIG